MIFIPKKLHVGFKYRDDTYNGKLACITYTDDKNKKRKVISWTKCRNTAIPVLDLDNVPTKGFTLSEKIEGKSLCLNYERGVCRVYDPRGFEFGISIYNFFHILENTNTIKEKGLIGDFVYAWDGIKLMLLSVNSEEYEKAKEYSDSIYVKKIGTRDLKVGHIYGTKTMKGLVYLGKHNKEFIFGKYVVNCDIEKETLKYYKYVNVYNKFIRDSNMKYSKFNKMFIEFQIDNGLLTEKDGVELIYDDLDLEALRNIKNIGGYFDYVVENSEIRHITRCTVVESVLEMKRTKLDMGELYISELYNSPVLMSEFIKENKPKRLIVKYLGEVIKRVGY